jgi:hypothetical protein
VTIAGRSALLPIRRFDGAICAQRWKSSWSAAVLRTCRRLRRHSSNCSLTSKNSLMVRLAGAAGAEACFTAVAWGMISGLLWGFSPGVP